MRAATIAAMIEHYRGRLTGYIVNRWRWLIDVEALISYDDFEQIATLAIVELAEEWPQFVAKGYPASPMDNQRSTWGLLAERAKWAVAEYARKSSTYSDANNRVRSIDAALDTFEEEGWMPRGLNAALRTEHTGAEKLLHRALVDYLAGLPVADQAVLALRYVEERTTRETADLLGTHENGALYHLRATRQRFRAFALCQVLDDPPALPNLRPLSIAWTPTDALLDWLAERYGPTATISGWLAAARAAYLTDPVYLSLILDASKQPQGASAVKARRTVSNADAAEMQRRYNAGETHEKIAAAFGVTRRTVGKALHRRAVA